MIRTEKLRYTARVGGFVKRSLSKRDRKRLHCFGRCGDRECCNTRRINSTRQKNTERNVRNETHAYRIGHQLAQMLGSFVFGWYWLGCLVTELPVTFGFYSTIFECELVRRRKFVDSFVDRQRRGHVIKRQVLS